jgi:chromate transporter
MMRENANQGAALKELAKLFLKLGLTAFGGPAAHIAMMQKEVVEKRKWMDHEHFLDLIGATNLIPGPNSTEMAIHIGGERGGWKGFLVAGFCFIMPAVLITGLIAWLYQSYGQLPKVMEYIYGIKPAIIAIILSAIIPLARKALKGTFFYLVAVLAFLASLVGLNEIYVMIASGLVVWLLYLSRQSKKEMENRLPGFFLNLPLFSSYNLKIFFIFLKIGAVLYGSGYVLFAFLDSELVSKGLLSRNQLVDAIAVGQFTPGPLFSSVTFIGWQMNGLQGAALATTAIFLPSFVFVALLNPLVPHMRKSGMFSAFLDGVNVAAVALILNVCVQFGRETIRDGRTVLIALMSMAVMFAFPKINSVFVIIGSAAMGYLMQLI